MGRSRAYLWYLEEVPSDWPMPFSKLLEEAQKKRLTRQESRDLWEVIKNSDECRELLEERRKKLTKNDIKIDVSELDEIILEFRG